MARCIRSRRRFGMDPNVSTEDVRPAPARRSGRRRRWPWIVGGVLAAVVIGLGIGEALGWPFMAAPVEHWLARTLDRKVQFSADPAIRPRVEIRLLGSLRVHAAYIEIGAPAWSSAPYMLQAR